jgi:hypothetical protein
VNAKGSILRRDASRFVLVRFGAVSRNFGSNSFSVGASFFFPARDRAAVDGARAPVGRRGPADPRGSHCGAGAPGATYFVGCNSPTPVQSPLGLGWIRLTWGAPGTLPAFGPLGLTNISGMTVDAIQIIFDEGQDTGPDNFGMAVLDNIRVNNQVAGRGPGSGS